MMFRLACALACLAFPVAAQECGHHEAIVNVLAADYGEGRITVALDARGLMVETFANLDTGTWTVLLTSPDGTSCLVASGQSYEVVMETAGQGT